jgi:hypothetical protein
MKISQIEAEFSIQALCSEVVDKWILLQNVLMWKVMNFAF